MQVFKAFLKILKSKFPSAVIYIVLFFLVGMLMTKTEAKENVWEKTQLKIVVEDLDNTPESRAIVDIISKGNVVIAPLESEDDLTDALYYTTVDYAVTIPKGFAERLTAGETENLLDTSHIHESYATANVEMLIGKFVNTYGAYRLLGYDSSEASAKSNTALSEDAVVEILTKETEAKSSNETLLIFFRFLPYILLCVILNMLCPALIVMSKKDIRFRTDCSGIRPTSYTMQLFTASALYIGVIWLTFVVVGAALNGVVYTGRLWLVVLNSLLFALFGGVLALFISEFAPSETVVNLLTQLCSLGMCFLCGVFVDQSLMGAGVLSVAQFLPAYWYVRVLRMIGGEIPFSAGGIAMGLGIQAAFIVVFVLLTLLTRRSRYAGFALRKKTA
ncbi:MAG: ABC transporter permease [Lachnospiraceae bacterium]|nr:ABC transporter permease [Lachnospiraceae bacterium]